jgi:hypothetical protein
MQRHCSTGSGIGILPTSSSVSVPNASSYRFLELLLERIGSLG